MGPSWFNIVRRSESPVKPITPPTHEARFDDNFPYRSALAERLIDIEDNLLIKPSFGLPLLAPLGPWNFKSIQSLLLGCS
jgi:hypothetical protein